MAILIRLGMTLSLFGLLGVILHGVLYFHARFVIRQAPDLLTEPWWAVWAPSLILAIGAILIGMALRSVASSR